MPDGAELLTRFENLPFTRWHTRARVVVGSATFFDGFDSLSLAFALPVLIRLWKITPAESGLLISSSYVGQIFGALTFSWLAEKHGRIRSATVAVALMSVMSLGCALSTNFAMLFAFRFVQGIGLGGEMPVAATYISEVSKARGRGRLSHSLRNDFSDRTDGCRPDRRAGCAHIRMAGHVSAGRHSRCRDCISSDTASGITAMADLAGPPRSSGTYA